MESEEEVPEFELQQFNGENGVKEKIGEWEVKIQNEPTILRRRSLDMGYSIIGFIERRIR